MSEKRPAPDVFAVFDDGGIKVLTRLYGATGYAVKRLTLEQAVELRDVLDGAIKQYAEPMTGPRNDDLQSKV